MEGVEVARRVLPPVKINETGLSGLRTVDTEVIADNRGEFYRSFCDQDLAPLLAGRTVRQVNFSSTKAPGTVRGFHLQQSPCAEMKLIRCVEGRVWDVAVDLRRGSPTLFQWFSVELSASNKRMVVIPEGFAHGFQVLEPSSRLLYLHTFPYVKISERGFRFDEPLFAVDWPLEPTGLSDRDLGFDYIPSEFQGIDL